MVVPNLYWPVYKNLEKEFLQLSDYIHFCDEQMKVYSMHIADLIVRCSIEIEALSKELYNLLGGNMAPVDKQGNKRDLYFDTDCLDLLEQKWHLGKKEITVSATTFYFTEEKNKRLTPLYKANKRGTSGSKWKQAYQAVKHDRRNSLKKANIENLLHAMGALYILNLYYKDERTDMGRVYLRDPDFDSRAGSEIFSAQCFHATMLSMSEHMDDSCITTSIGQDIEKSIFIIKYDDTSFRAMHKSFCLDWQITKQRFSSSPEIIQFLNEHPEYKDKSVNEICFAAGGENLVFKIICLQNQMKERSTKMESMLNKHSSIYPELFPLGTQN